MRMPSRLIGLTTLGLALAACGQQPAPSVGGDTVTLTLRSPLGLTAQGLPTDANGLSTVRHLAVKVTDANGTPVNFDGNNV